MDSARPSGGASGSAGRVRTPTGLPVSFGPAAWTPGRSVRALRAGGGQIEHGERSVEAGTPARPSATAAVTRRRWVGKLAP